MAAPLKPIHHFERVAGADSAEIPRFRYVEFHSMPPWWTFKRPCEVWNEVTIPELRDGIRLLEDVGSDPAYVLFSERFRTHAASLRELADKMQQSLADAQP
ncbi:MAG: hypothetical protein LRZ85_02850 [Alphaproteobacteria bacterium]|nr:hypothetical protein [Alphaproteobacteria bacterium]MCD8520281.1 hypothetical protein [Alphaproteobacteria bacterium]MCD8526251.1 hypothetical protein [Alphaproteobacteria bacterium]MCD8570202.1 hypothetical protein [Alphaproteobacteria bacterium]